MSEEGSQPLLPRGTARPARRRLTPCPDCGIEISARAIACPYCGRPLRVDLVLAVGFALVLFGVYVARVAEMLHQILR